MTLQIPQGQGGEARRQALIRAAVQNWRPIQEVFPDGQPLAPVRLDPPSPSDIIQASRKELQRKIYDFDQRTLERLGGVNSRLMREGKPPIQLKKVTEQVEAIAQNPSLSRKEKKHQIDALRKRLGLRKSEMKSLFTKRLKRIYGAEMRRLEGLARVTGSSALQVEANRLRSSYSLYKSFYPSFWARFCGFFKKIGGFLKGVLTKAVKSLVRWFPPVVLATTPGLDTVLETVFPPLARPIRIVRNLYKVVEKFSWNMRQTWEEFKEAWRGSTRDPETRDLTNSQT